MDQPPYESSQHFSQPIQPQPSQPIYPQPPGLMPPTQQLYPQSYTPPQPQKRSRIGWMVTTLVLLFIGMPLVGYWAYQAGYQSGRSTLPPRAAPVQTTEVAQPTQIVLPTQPPATGIWTDLQKWSDSVDQQTVVFTVPSEWRIVWSNTATESGGGGLVVYIYSSNGQVAGVPVDTDQASGGTTYEHAMPGQFYLDIQTVASSYTVEVQVQK